MGLGECDGTWPMREVVDVEEAVGFGISVLGVATWIFHFGDEEK